MFQDIVEASVLFDFYGQLLSERQRQVMELYYEENLSLGEIAEEFNISRQGVYDALKTAQKSLEHYEEKLGRKRDFERRQEIVNAMEREVEEIVKLRKKLDESLRKISDFSEKAGVLSKSQIEMQKNIEQLSEIGKNMRDDLNKLIE